VRAEYRLIEQYEMATPTPTLGIPLVAYYGDQDATVDADGVNAWTTATRTSFSACSFPGGHFYLEDHATHWSLTYSLALRKCPWGEILVRSDPATAQHHEVTDKTLSHK
jgi:surfactin synthase thioesterase subunit